MAGATAAAVDAGRQGLHGSLANDICEWSSIYYQLTSEVLVLVLCGCGQSELAAGLGVWCGTSAGTRASTRAVVPCHVRRRDVGDAVQRTHEQSADGGRDAVASVDVSGTDDGSLHAIDKHHRNALSVRACVRACVRVQRQRQGHGQQAAR